MNNGHVSEDYRIVLLESNVKFNCKEIDEIKEEHKDFKTDINNKMESIKTCVHNIQMSNRGTMITILVGLVLQISGVLIYYVLNNGGV